MIGGRAALVVLAAIAVSVPAQADVTISSAATQNMSCTGGTCVPTASDAVLNVTDLENMLASGNVTVTTTGSGVQAESISVTAKLAWAKTALALDAYQSLSVSAVIIAKGDSGLSILTNDGGSGGEFTFVGKGHVTFKNLAAKLSINGANFTLVNSVKLLASYVTANPSGNFALAADYDAGPDGTYNGSPIPTPLSGNFEGLGNTISNLAVHSSRNKNTIGSLFYANLGNISNFGLRSAIISGWGGAPLVLSNYGTITRCFATGSVHEKRDVDLGAAGGLVQGNYGTIEESWANVDAHGLSGAGGLVWANESAGVIINSYSLGAASGGWAGGLVGGNTGQIFDSYSSGTVKGGDYSGGLVGNDSSSAGSLNNNYWDTDTSGIADLSQGAGNVANDPGITGLTSAQFQSGLPAGFDPKIWAEDSNTNNGLPYLINNPPPN